MKIAILTPFLHREGGHGGITTWLLNVSAEFFRRGHTVELLVSAPAARALGHPRIDAAIRIVNLGNRTTAVYRNLHRYLRGERPDIILSAGYRYNSAIALVLPIARVDTRWVMTVRENLTRAVSGMPAGSRLRRSLALRLCLGIADRVVGVSADLTRDMVERWGLDPRKAGSIHNAVVDERIVERGREQVDHPFFSSGEKVLVAVGRLEPQKDYPTLLKAFAELRSTHRVRLIILGEGSLRGWLQALIEEMELIGYVDLAGFSSNPFSYMRWADGVVLSSLWEGFGNVLAEALAQGTPIVSTDCPSGPAEILDNGKYGPLVPVGDAHALADGMRRILDAPLPEETLKERARAFSVNLRVNDYLELFEALLKER